LWSNWIRQRSSKASDGGSNLSKGILPYQNLQQEILPDMFNINQEVQITDHSEDIYNNKWGNIRQIADVRGNIFYTVELDNGVLIHCIDEELMET
jgi:hypothetical protein